MVFSSYICSLALPALLVAPGVLHLNTNTPSVLSTDAVNESAAACIAQLPSPESRRSYECTWRFYRNWLAEQSLDATTVRPKHIQMYLAKLRDEGKKKGTIGRALTVIRSIYKQLVCDEIVPVNPAREVTGPKVDSTPKAPWIRDADAIKKLMNVPAANWVERRDRVVVRMTFGLGWRRAEVARAAVEDIEGNTITAPKIKGGKSLTVGIPKWVSNSITEWREFAGINQGPLFPRRVDDPRPINGAIVYRIVRAMCAKAGIDVVPPHALRRTYITHGGERGVDLKKRQLSVGHSSSGTTERYDRARDAAATSVGDVFEDLAS